LAERAVLSPPKPSIWTLTVLAMSVIGYGLAAAIAILAHS
jgi:hypothetical protein